MRNCRELPAAGLRCRTPPALGPECQLGVRVGRHLEPALAVLAAAVDDADIDLACAPTQCGRRFTGDRFHYRAYSFFYKQ